MPGEGPPSNVPLAVFGRYRVLHQIGAGSLGPVFRGEDTERRAPVALKILRLNLTPELTEQLVLALKVVADRIPPHPALAGMTDAGVADGQCYIVSPLAGGESLDAALHEYGPAAIADALPRLRSLAQALDRAAEHDVWHGALHPRDILVSAEETTLVGIGIAPALEQAGLRIAPRRTYTAPEIIAGGGTSPAADQFALAAIAHEWLFGRSVTGPVAAPLEIPALPDVDQDRLAGALTTALAVDPADRFGTCVAFVDAIAASVNDPTGQIAVDPRVIELASRRSKETLIAPVAAILPDDQIVEVAPPELAIADLRIDPDPPEPREGTATLREAPEGTATLRELPEESIPPIAPVAWQGRFAPADENADRAGYGAVALASMLVIGLAIGSVGGYLLGVRRAAPEAIVAQQSAPPTPVAPAPAPSSPVASESTEQVLPPPAEIKPPDAADAVAATPSATAPATTAPASSASNAAAVAPKPAALARLHIRTTPAGATVTVDGIERGVTPLALRDLEFGTRTVTITRPGYAPAQRQVSLTADRPSRSIDVRLTAQRTRATPRPPAATSERTATGTLIVESRPAGAAVSINGRASGVTPLTLPSLPPGSHRVRIERAGYQPWTTTVHLTAGERARVAASLVGGIERE